MTRFEVYGLSTWPWRKNAYVTLLCYIDAENLDKARERALNHYGSLRVTEVRAA